MGKDKKRDRDEDSDGQEKKKKKREKREDSSDSSGEEKKKKHKKDKKEKKHKHKDKKSSRSKPSEEISEDDYFAKNPEFRLWLAESKGKVFGDLSDKDTKKYFGKFVEKWNDGDLSEKIYKGVAFAELDSRVRTTHKWGFAKEKDTMAVESMKDKIFSDTQNATLLGGKPAAPGAAAAPARAAAPMGSAFEHEEERERQRAQQKLARKQDQKRQKEALEELAPRPDPGSFQARMEKRQQKGHYCRERPPSPEMKDSDLMGGGDTIKAQVMRQREHRERREAAKAVQGQAKLEAYREKEKETMNEFRRMMGLPVED